MISAGFFLEWIGLLDVSIRSRIFLPIRDLFVLLNGRGPRRSCRRLFPEAPNLCHRPAEECTLHQQAVVNDGFQFTPMKYTLKLNSKSNTTQFCSSTNHIKKPWVCVAANCKSKPNCINNNQHFPLHAACKCSKGIAHRADTATHY